MRKITYLINDNNHNIKVEEENVSYEDLYAIACCNLYSLIKANQNNPNFSINIFMNNVLKDTLFINDQPNNLS